MRKFSVRVLVAAAVFTQLAAAPVSAMTWHLRDWVYDDGGTAEGLFDYDYRSRQFSDVSVTSYTATGSVKTVYTDMASGARDMLLYLIEAPSADLTGMNTHRTQLIGTMYQEGTISALGGLKFETTCGNAACTSFGPTRRTLVSGVITTEQAAQNVPEIDAAAGMGSLAALTALFAFMRSRRRTAV